MASVANGGILSTFDRVSLLLMFVGSFNWLVVGVNLLSSPVQAPCGQDALSVVSDPVARRNLSIAVYLIVGMSGFFWLLREVARACFPGSFLAMR